MANYKQIETPVYSAQSTPYKAQRAAESDSPTDSNWKGGNEFDPDTYRPDRVAKWNEVNKWRKEMGLDALPYTWMFGRNRVFNPKYDYEKTYYGNWQKSTAWKDTRKKLASRNRAFGPAIIQANKTTKRRRSSSMTRGKTTLVQRALQTGLQSGLGISV